MLAASVFSRSALLPGTSFAHSTASVTRGGNACAMSMRHPSLHSATTPARHGSLCMAGNKAWNGVNTFINEYDFPAADFTSAQPPLSAMPEAPRRSRRRGRKAKASKKAATREEMFAMMRTMNAFISDYDFPSAPAPAPAPAPTAPPVGAALTQLEADADAVFAVLDLNGDGRISMAELGQHLKLAGYSQSAVDNIYRTLLADTADSAARALADNAVTRAELRLGFARFATLREAPGLIAAAAEKAVGDVQARADELYDAISADADGQISLTGLKAHLSGSRYSDAAVSNIFAMIDEDKNGEISRAELRGSLARYSALRLALGLGQEGDTADSAPAVSEVRYLW